MNLFIDDISEDLAVEMLIFECNLRISDKVQKMYDDTDGIGTSVEDYVQKETLKKFNYNPENLAEYRRIGTKFSDSKRVRDSAFFLKYNIMEPVPKHLYKEAVDASLINLDKTPTNLFNFIDRSRDRPLVILAGSIS